MNKKISIGLAVISAGLPITVPVFAATPTTWTTTYSDEALYGATGTIQFNDWGYQGPNGATAETFEVTSPETGVTGFDSTRIGQIQNVVTTGPDFLTRDGSRNVNATYTNASLDSQVNFGNGLYTTVAGSTFSNMQIDKAGNYYVAKNDMSFAFYDYLYYHDVTGAKPDAIVDTPVNFKPYATSDAMGWCGSTLVADPGGLDIMAGQVKYDFAFDAYTLDRPENPLTGGTTQLVPDFIMRSYGTYTLSMTGTSGISNYQGSAVMNNNNPTINPLDASGEVTGAALDPDYLNKVSFLGAGVVPMGVWVTGDSYTAPGEKRLNADGTWNVTILDIANPVCDPYSTAAAPVDGAICHANSFGGSSFMLRADAMRSLIEIDPTGHSDYLSASPVPVPAAAWLLSTGVLGLLGAARRK